MKGCVEPGRVATMTESLQIQQNRQGLFMAGSSPQWLPCQSDNSEAARKVGKGPLLPNRHALADNELYLPLKVGFLTET
ncbi:hypothetical protein VTK26DRAFT_5992 [Humicola hyalothermophila]